MKNKNNIQMVEYGFLHSNDRYENNEAQNSKAVFIAPDFFNEIEQFILENKKNGSEFLKPSFKKQYGKILQARQYVGILQSKNGTTLEILPKITNMSENSSREKNIAENKKLFLKMLKSLKDSPFKSINSANLQTQNDFPLLEIFITIFCDEMSKLIQKGLKQEYRAIEENSFFLKGKLLFQKHISQNFIHPERFFVSYDIFSENREENKLLKSTIQLLLKKSKYQKNISRLQKYLFIFNEIHESKNIISDFSKIKISRDMNNYIQPLQWAEIFLQKKHVTPVSGNSLASALLFDMNKIFEHYVAHCLRNKKIFPTIKSVKTQVSTQSLIESPNKNFTLKPDLLIIREEDDKFVEIIADTKWKVIKEVKNISQSDVYQMFAYAKKYKVDTVELIYPFHSKLPDALRKIKTQYFDSKKNIGLNILFFNIETNEYEK